MIELTALPQLNIIEPVSYENNKQQLVDRISSLYPTYPLFESSDEMVLIEPFAYELTYRDVAFNQRAREILPIFATGNNLDIAALSHYGTTRLEGENDSDFLIRSLYSLEQSTTAGSAWSYIYHTKSIDSHIIGVNPYRPTAGTVKIVWHSLISDEDIINIYMLNTEGLSEGELTALIDEKREIYNTALQESIVTKLGDPKIRPLNEHQIIAQAVPTDYSITAILRTAITADNGLIESQARESLNAFFATLKIGQEIRRSKLIALLHVAGVAEVTLEAPANNLIIGQDHIANCTAINLSFVEDTDE